MGLFQHKVFKLKDFTKATSIICFLLSTHLINFRNIDICTCVYAHTHTYIGGKSKLQNFNWTFKSFKEKLSKQSKLKTKLYQALSVFSVSLKPHETHTDAHAHTRTRTLKKEKQCVTELNGFSGSQATDKQCHTEHVGDPGPGSTRSRDREKGHGLHKTEASLTSQSRHVNYWLGSEPLQIIKRYLLFFSF